MNPPAIDFGSTWVSIRPPSSLNARLTPIALEVLGRDLEACEADAHPLVEDVVCYLEGQPDPILEAHLETCDTCLARAAAIADEQAGAPRAAQVVTLATAVRRTARELSGVAQGPREVLLANLPLLRDFVWFLARRYRLDAAQAEDFESFVRLRLVENDYGILRQWRRRSTLKTYLTVVMQRLFHDYCNQLWGKWRASAAALRLGPLAEALEELLYREGLTFAEACQVLSARGNVAPGELSRLHAQLPPRPGRPRTQPIGADEVAEPATSPSPEEAALQRAAEEEVMRAVAASLRRLRAEDRLLLRLHFGDGLSVAEAARGMGVPQKALYKRLTGVLKAIRRDLREAGVDRHDVSRLLQRGPTLDFALEAPRPEGDDEGRYVAIPR